MSRGKHNLGIALVSVLAVATVAIILAATFSFVITSERKSTSAASRISEGVQLADAASERARLKLVEVYKQSFLTSKNFLLALQSNQFISNTLGVNVLGVNTETIDGHQVRWEIRDYADPASEFHWIDVAATAETAKGAQTVIRRVHLGLSDIFSLAMLSERTDCMYCHLNVNGDVGSLEHLRPGWGEDLGGTAPSNGWEDGWNSGASGGGSNVNGDVFAAKTVTTDGSAGTINGVEVSGDVFTNYTGTRLPRDKDGDGIPDFPEINRTFAENNANGSLSGGTLTYVGTGTLGSIPGSSSAVASKNNGNAILIGTEANPIVLTGDVYFSGDVIIKGYVTGQGAIYAGRNVYVAGNINYKNPPPNCAQAANPDTCAQDAISAGKDELRLAARGNIVLGDYTERDAAGNPKTWQGLQSADFYRKQFGFESGSTKYYDKATGDELKLINSDYKNADGTVISPGNVKSVDGYQAYDYSLRPGKIDSGGNFQSWLSDGLYQQLLGTERRAYDTWRYEVERSSVSLADLQAQFSAYGVSDTSLTALLCPCSGDIAIDLKNSAGQVIGRVHWEVRSDETDSLRVIIDPLFSYEKQVTKVDAYLYSNQRIAGKTFNAPLAINGGMVSKEIGVLAPGLFKQWWMNPSDNRYNFLDTAQNDCAQQTFANQFRDASITDPNATGYYNGVFAPDVDDCSLTVNYDYRLRNGGLGYNLVAQDVGRTISWQVGSKHADRVGP